MNSQCDQAKRAVLLACGIGLLLTAAGCGGPKLPVVSGTVTLGGMPLVAATVIFMPEDETMSPAQATTDASGGYTLEQEADEEGIQPGKYSVRISTYQPASADEEPPVAAIKEKVSVRYNLETELNAVIDAEHDPDENPVNFDLETGGRIFQPAPESF
jgi:hypothetical protein